MNILEQREDGSFVIMHERNPYHVIPGDPLWDACCGQVEVDPVEQAQKYADYYKPVEPEEPIA